MEISVEFIWNIKKFDGIYDPINRISMESLSHLDQIQSRSLNLTRRSILFSIYTYSIIFNPFNHSDLMLTSFSTR